MWFNFQDYTLGHIYYNIQCNTISHIDHGVAVATIPVLVLGVHFSYETYELYSIVGAWVNYAGIIGAEKHKA